MLSELSLKITVLALFFHFSANNISSKWHPPMSVAAGEVLMENSRISGLSWSYSDQSPQQPAVCIFAAVCINCTHTNYAKLLRTTDPHAATTDPLILISIIMSQKATWYVDIWSSVRLNEWMVNGKYSVNEVFTILRVATTKCFFHTSDSKTIQAITQNTWLTATDWSTDPLTRIFANQTAF